MNIVNLELSKIQPNDYNPNVVPKKILSALTKSIEEFGIEQPILVRKEGEKYIIVDGEHRYLIAKKLGFKAVPVVIRDFSISEAKLQTINMNKLRGDFDKEKLAKVLVDLQEEYSKEELAFLTGFSGDELDVFNSLIEVPNDILDNDDDNLENLFNNDSDKKFLDDVALIFSVPEKDVPIIETALKTAGGVSREESLVKICKKYISKEK